MSRRFVSASMAILSSLAGPAIAQSVDLGGPIAGFIHETRTRVVRPVLGIAGAASLGPAILTGVDSAFVAPGGRWALFTADGRMWVARGLAKATTIEPAPPDLIDGVDRVVWTRDGSRALLCATSTRQIQRIRLSDGEVIVEAPVSISWGEISSMAIDAAGGRIAIGVAESGVYVLQNGHPPAQVSSIAQPTALTFDESGQRLYAVDAATQQILEFDSAYSVSEFVPLIEAGGAAPDPVGLAISKNGRYLLLADRAARAVRVYETASRGLTGTIALSSTPSGLELFSAEPAYLLNKPMANQCLLVLRAGDSPAVYFVPAGEETQR